MKLTILNLYHLAGQISLRSFRSETRSQRSSSLRTTSAGLNAQTYHAAHKSCYGSQRQNRNGSCKQIGQKDAKSTMAVPCMLSGVVVVNNEDIANDAADDAMTFDMILVANHDGSCQNLLSLKREDQTQLEQKLRNPRKLKRVPRIDEDNEILKECSD